MNIYIIPAWYPKNEQDITAVFFREQAHALADRGHTVTVLHISPISVTKLFRQPFHTRRVWQDGNVRTIFHEEIIPVPGKMGALQDRYISDLFYRIIHDEIGRDEGRGLDKPDVLHAHVSHTCGFYCLKASKELHIPLVVTEHYSGLLSGNVTPVEYQRVRDTINDADAFIFVGSNFQKTVCQKLQIKKKTYVIPNMVDDSLFSAVISHTEENRNTFTFLTACHLKKHKGVDLVVLAFHEAFRENDCVRLLIAGDGEERLHLERLVQDLMEGDRVTLIGRYSREEASTIFSQADAFVLTSQVEPFGIVYIEAMMAGLPCIGTRGQGADDIITEQSGILVDYGDIEQLAAAMRMLFDCRAKYESSVIQSQCGERFAPEAVCSAIEELYRAVQQK